MKFLKKIALSGVLLTLFSFSIKEQKNIVIYLIGDSTVCTQPDSQAPVTGWGTPFAIFFNPTVKVENHAKGGRSTRTFLSEDRWNPIFNKINPGDYVIMQFGHNDEAKEEIYKDRYTSPADYRKNLTKFIAETRLKSGNPILVTPVSRRRFDKEGNVMETHIEYSAVVMSLAKELNVPVVDLDTKSRALYQSYGAEHSTLLFNVSGPGTNPQFPDGINDNTHFSEYGARLLAELVLAEIKNMHLELESRLVARK